MADYHKLALYVFYYLSLFNDKGLKKFGYSSWNDAFRDAANRLAESVEILLINKEWEFAKQARDKYYLAIASNINKNPEISFIQNPAYIHNPKKNIVTTIQIQWSVSAGELQEIYGI